MTNQPLPNPTEPWWRTSPRDILRQVLRLDDTPHRIALGAAIGMFVGWTPTVGIQMIIVLVIAVLTRPFFRFNQFAGLVGVYVSNPITMLPMYWLMYWVGTFFVPGNATYEEFAAIADCASMSELWNTLKALFVDVGFPLIVGSFVLASFFSVLTYPAMRYLLARREPPADDESATTDEPVVTETNDEPAAPTGDPSNAT